MKVAGRVWAPDRGGVAAGRATRVLLVGDPAGETNVLLANRWRDLGLAVEVVAGDEIPGTTTADVVLGRLDVLPSLDGVSPGLFRLLRLERRGAHLLNGPFGLLAAHDKLLTARALARAALPTPATAHLRPGCRPSLPPPLVLKPRFGSWGRDVFRCDTPHAVARCLAEVADRPWFRRHGAIVQELVPSAGRDLRVIVAGGSVVGAIERRSAAGEWRTNISLGGSVHPMVPPADAARLAIAVAAALGLDLCGVDLLPVGGGGWIVVEANAAADFDARYSLPGQDVFVAAAASLGLVRAPADTAIA